MEFVRIAPGTFQMGVDSVPLPKSITDGVNGVVYPRTSDAGDYDESPVHSVTISRAFLIGVTEVTIEQYRHFRPDYRGNPYYAPYANGVSWDDAVAFCKWLSAKEGKTYRLPTEAEWEFAARAGTRTPFSSGMERPAPETANAWGVKNMSTGVAEWVWDFHGAYPHDAQIDPVGPAWGIARVVRGGGLDYKANPKSDGGKHFPAEMSYYARSANRASMAPTFASPESGIGFRVVQAEMPATAPTPYDTPMVSQAVKQTADSVTSGPDPAKPYFHTREIFPQLGERNMREVGWRIGLKPGLGSAYHNSAVQVCPNGDLIAAYYNTPEYEDDPDQTILTMRLRYGSDEWDMPEAWPVFADAAEAAPVIWNERGKMWFFFGSPRLLGGGPFQYMTSTDSGATWSAVTLAKLTGPVGKFTPQPINSVVRAADGTIYLPVDGAGGESVLFASSDNGAMWRDTGGRTAGRHTTLVIGKDGSLIGFGGKNTNIDGFMPKAISRDGGKTYVKSKTPFRPLGSGQRPSLIRLASGRLFFVADKFDKKKLGATDAGAFVALSDDDGERWKTRDLPNVVTVGYVTATQGPNSVIHIVTSKNKPDLHIEMNEAWALSGGGEIPYSEPKAHAMTEKYPDGKLRAEWSGGVSPEGRYLLTGKQTFYYENGQKQWEATFRAGRRTGVETWWSRDGVKSWEKSYGPDQAWTWKLFDASGRVTAESKWRNKELLEVGSSREQSLPDLYHDEKYGDAPYLSEKGWRPLLNGRDLSGWHAVNNAASEWFTTAAVNWRRVFNPTHLTAQAGPGDRIVNGKDGKTANLVTDEKFGSFELYAEFMLAKGSNSGIYLHGLYEVQIFDSFGFTGPLTVGDCGGIYELERGGGGSPPARNASRPPGEWQSLRIWFQAPQLDAIGKMIANGKILRVLLNDVPVQENFSLAGPTLSHMETPEAARNPIMLQGDHGPVAFRNIYVKPIE